MIEAQGVLHVDREEEWRSEGVEKEKEENEREREKETERV